MLQKTGSAKTRCRGTMYGFLTAIWYPWDPPISSREYPENPPNADTNFNFKNESAALLIAALIIINNDQNVLLD